MATTVAAPPAQADTTYRKGQYSATKISHPDQPLRSADGIIDFNGAPDRAQSYSWSAVGYGDDIYIGTCYAPSTRRSASSASRAAWTRR